MGLQAHHAISIHNPGRRHIHVECFHVVVCRDDDERERMFFDKRLDESRVRIRVEADELNVGTILILLDEFLNARKLRAAYPSPSRPKGQVNDFAFQRSQVPSLATEVGEFEGGQGFTSILPR